MIAPLSILGFGHVELDEHASTKLDLTLLERTLRRGLSDTTRLFMHAAKLALDDAALAAEGVHVIFASAFGEIATAEALLREAFDADGSSPARFRNSVHNTASGLLSISTHNQLSSTALAAGWDTVGMALYEASAELAHDAERVLLVFAEERVPLALSPDHPHAPLGVAFVLARHDVQPRRGVLANLRRLLPEHAAQHALQRAASDLAADAPPFVHPLAPALAIARALAAHEACTLAVGDGVAPLCVDVIPEVHA